MSRHLLRLAVLAAMACGTSSCGDKTNITSGPVALKITSVQPKTGLTDAHTAVTVIGQGFKSGATLTFDGTEVPATILSGGYQMTATTPAHSMGGVDVVVTNPGGESSRLEGGFTYTAQVVSLALTGITAMNGIGEVVQLTATATFSDGATKDVTKESNWVSSYQSVATVSQGVVTATGLGASVILAQYPVISGKQQSTNVTVTPNGTYVVSTRVRQPGSGGIQGVRVVHVPSGASTETNDDGEFFMGNLIGPHRFSFSKTDFEPIERDVPETPFFDMPMQRIVRIVPGSPPVAGELAPNDLEYTVGSGTRCQPCRLIRIQVSQPGTVMCVSWTAAPVKIWVGSQSFTTGLEPHDVCADLPVTAGEVIAYIGTDVPLQPGLYVPYTLSVGVPKQVSR